MPRMMRRTAAIVAFYMPIFNDVSGLGVGGSNEIEGYVMMCNVNSWVPGNGQSANFTRLVLGQEFEHRLAMFLGRQTAAHRCQRRHGEPGDLRHAGNPGPRVGPRPHRPHTRPGRCPVDVADGRLPCRKIAEFPAKMQDSVVRSTLDLVNEPDEPGRVRRPVHSVLQDAVVCRCRDRGRSGSR